MSHFARGLALPGQTLLIRSFVVLQLALTLLAVSMMSPASAQSNPSPSMKLYAEVSTAREKYSDVIWGNKPATPDELHAIIRALEADNAKLDAPLARELAEGNVYLRYRRYNILCDLIRLHARLDERDAALQAWQALMNFQWSADAYGFEQSAVDEHALDDKVAALTRMPGYEGIAAQRKVAAWWSKAPSIRTPYRAQLPVDERIAGVSLLWSTARNGFVWFDHVPELDWDAAYREALNEAIAAPDTLTYYKGLTRFVARLHDGHSNVYLPDALKSEVGRPGIRTRLIGDKVVVASVSDAQLQAAGVRVGDEVLTVDGVPVREYAERNVRPYVSASTPQDSDVRVYRYELLMGNEAVPVKLQLVDANGKRYDVSAPRSGYRTLPVKDEPLFRMRDDGVAVLRTTQFEDDAALKAFEAGFDQLSHARGLVLDLRGNGGGSTENGTRILAHLSRKSLPAVHVMYVESIPFQQTGSTEPSLSWRNITDDDSGEAPKAQYDGPVVMLIDARTFSAAEDTASLFQRMHRGMLIGMPTGGSTGQPLMLALPGGGTARICVKRDMAPDGSTFVGKGIQPDLRLDVTQDDMRAQRDVVLERAVSELLKTSPSH